MEHTHTGVAHEQHGHDASTKGIWKTFWILLAITIFEVGLAFLHLETGIPPKLLLNSVFIGLTLLKAFFIVAEFMHLRNEIRNLIMTILVPLLLFIWFIIAFLADGDSWKKMRKDLSPGTPAPAVHVVNEEAHH
ncbi:Cytochrome C oxidase subunit IV [Chitinophaga sp. CF118]|uniref:cytochrome C oxidase subunit IV family protein n=1 Tax=Chitinophaga sp. CF118 TaxID=1884367 RepID=UPI0008EDFF5A|nr:cytochrome C oxidase subunit IV family protein [Chitinophaga sp. CF118]SFD30655.1 Cytochrome C oxidase subunit IV [Chitinophaga sp. CF118]